jgi:uncharacterized protein YjbI with pentapeptide repeats
LSDTSIRGASLRCANLSEADLTNLKLDDARLGFANIYQADTDIRKSLIERGAIEIENIKWQEWQKSDFDGKVLKKY